MKEQNNSTIHIFWKHYNTEKTHKAHLSGNGRIPSWFSFESCFLSLLDSIKDRHDVKVHLIMDSTDLENNFISKYKDYYILKLIDATVWNDENDELADQLAEEFPKRVLSSPTAHHDPSTVLSKKLYPLPRDYVSIRETLKYMKSLNVQENDRMFMCDNDYLFVTDWVDKVNILYKDYPNLTSKHYVCPMDLRHKYHFLCEDKLKDKITDNPRFNNFNLLATGTKDEDLWKSGVLEKGHHHWMTSTPIGPPHAIVTKSVFDEDFDIAYETVRDSLVWNRLHTEMNRLMISPLPGLSCHIMNRQLSPGVDWKILSNKFN